MNNAAVVGLVWQPFDQWTEEWDQLLTVNLRGMWFCARALGRELGEFGIRVNALAPGYTMSAAQSRHVAVHPEHAVAMRARRAICRDELPEDLAGPAFFLASADSDFMSCQSLVVEGGGGSMW